MTQPATPAEAFTERLLNAAAVKYRNFQKLHPITFMQAGDNDELCSTCMVGIVRGTDGWRHDPDEVRRLRELATEGAWPR